MRSQILGSGSTVQLHERVSFDCLLSLHFCLVRVHLTAAHRETTCKCFPGRSGGRQWGVRGEARQNRHRRQRLWEVLLLWRQQCRGQKSACLLPRLTRTSASGTGQSPALKGCVTIQLQHHEDRPPCHILMAEDVPVRKWQGAHTCTAHARLRIVLQGAELCASCTSCSRAWHSTQQCRGCCTNFRGQRCLEVLNSK